MADPQVYDGIKVEIGNVQEFHLKFMENQYQLWQYRLERLTLKREGKLTFEEIERVNQEQQPTVDKLKKLYMIEWWLRHQLWDKYETNFKEAIDKKAKDDPVWWINNFAWTHDPRLANIGLPAKIPLILYPQQEDVVREIEFCYKSGMPFIVKKSRAEGLTEIVCAFMIHHWLYHEGFAGTLGSRQEREVDEIGNPDTLFSRLRRILYNLPPSMRPKGFEKEDGSHDNKLRLVNPDMGTSIIGAGGDNIGRGGRSSISIIDEKAFVEHQDLVDKSLSMNTDCQGDVSTPNGMNHFFDKIESGKCHVITVWWYKNPAKNLDWKSGKRPKYSHWYRFMEMTKSKTEIAQEIDIDFNASVEGVFIEAPWVLAAVDFDIPEEGDKVGGFDPSSAGENKSVYVSRTGPVLTRIHVSPHNNAIEATWDAIDRGEEDGIGSLNYDQNNVGEDILPTVKLSDRKINFPLRGIYGNSPATQTIIASEGKSGKDLFRNKRAEIWWNLRTRFFKTWQHVNNIHHYPSSELISIPADSRLMIQLSTPLLIRTAGGKRGVESKVEMKARGVKSPDHADAVAYCYADDHGEKKVINEFDYTTNSTNFTSFTVNYEKAASMQYVSVYLDDNLTTSVIGCIWHHSYPKVCLEVYLENSEHNPDIEVLIRETKAGMKDGLLKIKEWVANDLMFDGLEKGQTCQWHSYRKNGVTLTKNYTFDEYASLSLLNDMFKKNMIQIHTDCEETMNQLRNWSIEKGKPGKKLGYANCLLQLIGRMRTKKLISAEKIKHAIGYNGESRLGRSLNNLKPTHRKGYQDGQKNEEADGRGSAVHKERYQRAGS